MSENHCEDCGKEFNYPFVSATVRAESARYGVYYEGNGICQDCKEERYERQIREMEPLSNGV